MFEENFRVNGVRKVWRQLKRQGFDVDYRPDNMRVHVDFRHYFDQSTPQAAQCAAGDIELKWKRAGYLGRL